MSVENGGGPAEEMPAEERADDAESVEALKAEIVALRDRSLRALAEADNVRKRAERERDESRQYAVTRFARDLLTVADNLARAIAAYPATARNDASDALNAVIDGVEATERELQNVLTRNGVKIIAAEGARFDPHLHQAIAEVPAPDAAPGTVVTVVQSGYTIGERLLRPAMVTVARADGARGPQAANGSNMETGG